MTSPVAFSPETSFLSFRKESIGEEDSLLDTEIAQVIEELKTKHPDCDRLGEINTIVAHCKQKLKECIEIKDTVNRAAYMEKIVQLGLEKQALEDSGPSQAVVRCKGHNFVLQPTRGRHNPCCEVCMCTIWRLLQAWRRCTVCGYRTHAKCAADVHRICAGVPTSRRDFSLVYSISESKGLDEQKFSCAECQAPLIFEGPVIMEPRLCDYTGLLFCPNCHWGDTWSIPARILNNMDPTPRPVCRAVKQLLSIVDNRPLINMSQASSSISKYHKEFKKMQKLRRDFLFMKCYFISCHTAKKLRILQYLNRHQHFVENSDMYSLAELRELCQGSLLQNLEDIHTVFKRHIEEECETCRGNGFYCELCEDPKKRNEIIFPFSEAVSICSTCLNVFHSKCFELKSFHCPRCERRKKRAPAILPSTFSSEE